MTDVDWDTWFNKPGMPIYEPDLTSDTITRMNELISQFLNDEYGHEDVEFFKNGTVNMQVTILNKIKLKHSELLNAHKLLDKLYEVLDIKNSQSCEVMHI